MASVESGAHSRPKHATSSVCCSVLCITNDLDEMRSPRPGSLNSLARSIAIVSRKDGAVTRKGPLLTHRTPRQQQPPNAVDDDQRIGLGGDGLSCNPANFYSSSRLRPKNEEGILVSPLSSGDGDGGGGDGKRKLKSSRRPLSLPLPPTAVPLYGRTFLVS